MKSAKILVINILLSSLVLSCKNDTSKNVSYGKSNDKSSLEKSIERGKLVYNDLCITCHMANGEGVAKVFPPLANSDYLKENQTESIRGVKYGQKGEMVVNGVTYNGVMAPMGLEDDEVADVMNYINNSWGNNFGKEVTVEEVTKVTK
ncbi:cytochrome c [Winogradskyella wandonensis]|uniref:Cytochrome c n=1 Tax=Winogradskyella wandonensis TaxID=1442586 RepID=A0A4V6NEL9_9FLAO|nr:cytochrome c [Winogradskyella wandonensis]TCK66691.1 cytochrome c [Winogradskyella wandonensis]